MSRWKKDRGSARKRSSRMPARRSEGVVGAGQTKLKAAAEAAKLKPGLNSGVKSGVKAKATRGGSSPNSLESVSAGGLEEKPFLSSAEMEAVVSENRSLKQLQQIIRFLNSSESMDDLLAEIVDLGLKLSSLNNGVLAIMNGRQKGFKIRHLRGWLKRDQKTEDFSVIQSFVTLITTDRKPYYAPNMSALGGRPSKIGALVALPLKVHDQVFGCLVLSDEQGRADFQKRERDLLTSFADHAALAYRRLLVDEQCQREKVKLKRSLKTMKCKMERVSQRLQAQSSPDGPLKEAKQRFYSEYLKSVLKKHQGRLSAAAKEARVSKQQFMKLLKRYGVLESATIKKAAS